MSIDHNLANKIENVRWFEMVRHEYSEYDTILKLELPVFDSFAFKQKQKQAAGKEQASKRNES